MQSVSVSHCQLLSTAFSARYLLRDGQQVLCISGSVRPILRAGVKPQLHREILPQRPTTHQATDGANASSSQLSSDSH